MEYRGDYENDLFIAALARNLWVPNLVRWGAIERGSEGESDADEEVEDADCPELKPESVLDPEDARVEKQCRGLHA